MNPLHTADRLAHSYLDAKNRVIEAGFASEVDWQEDVDFEAVTEAIFLKEYTWVVFSSGFREAILAQKFPNLVAAFCGLANAQSIDRHRVECRQRAIRIFAHQGKIHAVLAVAETICKVGFGAFKERIRAEGVEFLDSLPFLGPATSLHLGKNIGLDMVKPDRHLLRIAHSSGFETPWDLCASISGTVGDTLAVVDVVIWRYATLFPDQSLPGFSPTFQCVRNPK